MSTATRRGRQVQQHTHRTPSSAGGYGLVLLAVLVAALVLGYVGYEIHAAFTDAFAPITNRP